ncbi:MAG: hypothetical protein SGILL_008008 [Bacillariaceae sp.]
MFRTGTNSDRTRTSDSTNGKVGSNDVDQRGDRASAVQLPKPSEMDALLTNELNQLSLNDREKAMEEIHGVHARDVERAEEETHLQQSLDQLQVQLDMILDNDLRQGYDAAVALNSTYIFQRKFRLMFIRAEQYDASKAAIRLLSFLNFMRELFGDCALMRPIRLDDLSDNAQAILAHGGLQILPARDSAGRRIVVALADSGAGFSHTNRARMSMYFWQALAEDETSQRLGTVMLLFFHIMDGTVIPDAEMRNILVRIMDACPIHSSAVHYCLPNTPFCHALKTAYLLVIGKRFRSRSRFHVGATTECFYSLKGFGIPVHQIPNNLDFSTREKKKNHIKWVSFRQAKDRLTETNPSLVEDIVECPQPEDYLYGKGQAVMKHPGNLAMRNMLKERLDRWEDAAFKDKSGITWEVVNAVTSGGGRFLKEAPEGWYTVVELEAARQKVSIALRDMAKRVRRRKQQEEDMKLSNPQVQAAAITGHNMRSQQQAMPLFTSFNNGQPIKTFNNGQSINFSNELPQKRRRMSNGQEFGCWNGVFYSDAGNHSDNRSD